MEAHQQSKSMAEGVAGYKRKINIQSRINY